MEKKRNLITTLSLILVAWSIILVGISSPGFFNTGLALETEDPNFKIEASPKANFTGSYSSLVLF